MTKTDYKINGHSVYLPDQWEASYKDGIGVYSETVADDTPQEVLENSATFSRYVLPNAMVEISGKTITIKVYTNIMPAMMTSEFLTQYMIMHGKENVRQLMAAISGFMSNFEKETELER